MSIDSLVIPTRKNSDGKLEVETRPVYVEEWLDSLPYVDFDKTTQLLNKAMRETNHVSMKPSQRIDLISQYNRPYQYYIDSQIKVGARHTLRSIETLQTQIHSLKQLSVAMAMACRVAIEETLNKKTLWLQSKPPLDAILMSMNYLSHTLIFSYLEYSPVPKNIWREINFLYDFTESINRQDTLVHEISDSRDKKRSSISAAYKRIILASMVDPHHLPFGAVWEIFSQLETWVNDAEIMPYQDMADAAGYFVMDIKNDVRPVPYSKFNKQLAKDRKLRILDARKLVSIVQTQLNLIQTGRPLDDSILFSSHYAKSVLKQMTTDWGLPAKRKHKRQAKTGDLKLAIGINSSHYFINGKQNFTINQQADEDDIDNLIHEATGEHTISYSMEPWQLVDYGAGGYAISREIKSDNSMRVGDLVAIPVQQNTSYNVGIVRWLMVRSNNNWKAGIQLIGKQPNAVAVRPLGSNNAYHRGLLFGDLSQEDAFLVTEQGLYAHDKMLEIYINDQNHQIKVDDLKESTTILEQFGINKQ